MIFVALQAELFRFKFHKPSLKFPKNPEFNLSIHLKTYFAGCCSIYSFLADFGGRSKEIISSLASKVVRASARFCGFSDLRPPPDVVVGGAPKRKPPGIIFLNYFLLIVEQT